MWAVVATQAQAQIAGLPTAFWLGLAGGLPTVLWLASVTLMRREFKTDHPNIDQFNALKDEVEELPKLIERTDVLNREARNAEFGRLRDSIEGTGRELRELVRELRGTIEKMREEYAIEREENRRENARIVKDFELFRQSAEMRLERLEYDRQQDRQRKGAG